MTQAVFELIDYRSHRIKVVRAAERWFAYIFPPGGYRALNEIGTAKLSEGRDEALNRAYSIVDGLQS